MTKSTVFCRFVTFTEEIFNAKLYFLCSDIRKLSDLRDLWTSVAAVRRRSSKIGFHKNFAISQFFHRKTPVLECLFNKVSRIQACNLIKKRLTQIISCHYYEFFQSIFFSTTVYYYLCYCQTQWHKKILNLGKVLPQPNQYWNLYKIFQTLNC